MDGKQQMTLKAPATQSTTTTPGRVLHGRVGPTLAERNREHRQHSASSTAGLFRRAELEAFQVACTHPNSPLQRPDAKFNVSIVV